MGEPQVSTGFSKLMDSIALDPELDMDEGDLEKLESDVKQMAKKISSYRKTLPDRLRNTLESAVSSHIPVSPNIDSESDPLPPSCVSIAETPAPIEFGTEEKDTEEKMIRLKEIISRNAANIPKLVKRMRECVEGINKLESLDVTINPTFRKRRKN